MTEFIDKPVTTNKLYYNMNMSECPLGRKLLALNYGGVACFAAVTNANRNDFQGWCALPKVPKKGGAQC